jgi:hypothetical protein
MQVLCGGVSRGKPDPFGQSAKPWVRAKTFQSWVYIEIDERTDLLTTPIPPASIFERIS